MTELPSLRQIHGRGTGRPNSQNWNGQDWLGSWTLLEHMELWDGDLNKEGERLILFPFLWEWPGWSWCSLLWFPKDGIFKWEEELWEQPVNGLGSQRLAELYFFGCFRGNGPITRQKPAILPKLCSFWIKDYFFIKLLPPEFAYRGKAVGANLILG